MMQKALLKSKKDLSSARSSSHSINRELLCTARLILTDLPCNSGAIPDSCFSTTQPLSRFHRRQTCAGVFPAFFAMSITAGDSRTGPKTRDSQDSQTQMEPLILSTKSNKVIAMFFSNRCRMHCKEALAINLGVVKQV